MKIRTSLAFVILCLGMNSACQGIPSIKPVVEIRSTPEKKDSVVNPLAIFKANLVSNELGVLDSLKGATRYQIELIIDETLTSITGHQDVVYTNNEATALDQIYFNLNPNIGGDYIKVENIQLNGEPVVGVMVFKNSVLEIDLAEPLQSEMVIDISMDFSETVPIKMAGNYGLYIFQDDILALDSFFPIIPVYDDDGWNVQDPPSNADMIYTDASFFEVQVDAPIGIVLAASGFEVNITEEGSRQIATFVGGPQRDFYLAASSRFQNASKQSSEVKVTSYFPKEFKESGNLVLETAVKALQVFSMRYGLYPYTELDLVSTPMQAGGMEYSGAIAMALGLYGQGTTPSGASDTVFLEYATAHEVAHQWFFNQVMNDQMEEPWLDEGFAQYLTYVYYLDTYGGDAAEQVRASWERYWSAADKQPIPIGMPAGDYASNEYAAIIYGRAPLFILELEKKMGAEVFSRFLTKYVNSYRWKTVDTQQFKSLAEESCKCDLTSMFNKWGVVE
jgi:hypothetical protein